MSIYRSAAEDRAGSSGTLALHWRDALLASGVGVWEWCLPEQRVRWDAGSWRLLGYSTGDTEMDISRWRELVHPDELEGLLQQARQQLVREALFEVEYRARHADGSWCWLAVRGKVVARDAAGRAIRLIGTQSDISRRKHAELRAQQLAYHDALTGLPNRRLLLDRLQQALASAGRSGLRGALIFIDLDYFKQLNDSLGHEVGDALLVQVAQRLSDCVRSIDTVARLGGDEFVVMLGGLEGDAREAAQQVEWVARKVLAELARPFSLAGQACSMGGSLGVALFGQQEDTPEALLRRADLAMYRSKRCGRNTVHFFDAAMQHELEQHRELVLALRDALGNGELTLHYQRQVDAMGHQWGAEALLRWQHPARGMLRGNQIMALAQDSALGTALGDWVLAKACRQLQRWQAHPVRRHWLLSLNLGAAQFFHPAFPQQLAATLAAHEVDPARLRFEVAESLVAGRYEEAARSLAALQACGISLVLDDFGSGLSALSALRHLPFAGFKVDCRVLFEAMDEQGAHALSRAFLSLGDSMRLAVLARGVETAAQHRLLLAAGYRLFQGDYFGQVAALPALEAEPSGRLA